MLTVVLVLKDMLHVNTGQNQNRNQNRNIRRHMKMLRVHVSGICCNKLNFMGHVAGTKSPPNWCCTIIKVSVHTRDCKISLKHAPATFSCAHTCCDFVSATRRLSVHYTSFLPLLHVPATWPLVSTHLIALMQFFQKPNFDL